MLSCDLAAGPLRDLFQDGVAVLLAVHQGEEDVEQRRGQGEQRVRVAIGYAMACHNIS